MLWEQEADSSNLSTPTTLSRAIVVLLLAVSRHEARSVQSRQERLDELARYIVGVAHDRDIDRRVPDAPLVLLYPDMIFTSGA